jgi:hypothetical protein
LCCAVKRELKLCVGCASYVRVCLLLACVRACVLACLRVRVCTSARLRACVCVCVRVSWCVGLRVLVCVMLAGDPLGDHSWSGDDTRAFRDIVFYQLRMGSRSLTELHDTLCNLCVVVVLLAGLAVLVVGVGVVADCRTAAAACAPGLHAIADGPSILVLVMDCID